MLQAARSASSAYQGSSGRTGAAYERLCLILRKCSLGGPEASLSVDEQGVLTELQQAVRDHLEHRRQRGSAADPAGPC